MASDDGQKFLLNQPATVDALQKMQDLIYRYHVAPTPSTLQSMPSASFMLQTGRVAMDIGSFSQMVFDWAMVVLSLRNQPLPSVLLL